MDAWQRAVEKHQQLYERWSAEIEAADPEQQEAVADYRKRAPGVEGYANASKLRQFTIIPGDELTEALGIARVLLVSHYQTLNQGRYRFAQQLKSLIKTAWAGKPVAFALDVFAWPPRHTTAVYAEELCRAYFAGEIDTWKFLDEIGVIRAWDGDYAESYVALLELARESGVSLLVADPVEKTSPTLFERDLHATKAIDSWLQQHPDGHVAALFGELRVESGFLQTALQEMLGNDIQLMTLLQDPVDFYWPLARANLALMRTNFKVTDTLYANLNVPPLVKLDSCFAWGANQRWLDWPPQPSFWRQFGEIEQALQLPQLNGSSTKPHLLTLGDAQFLADLQEDGFYSAEEKHHLQQHLEKRESTYLPGKNIVFLGSLTKLHAGEEIGHWARLRTTKDLDEARSAHESYYYMAVNEAAGYLASKVVSPSRKPGADALEELERARRGRVQHVLDQGKAAIWKHAHQAGYALGEKLFELRSVPEQARQKWKKLFGQKCEGERSAFHLFQELSTPASSAADEKPKETEADDFENLKPLHMPTVAVFYFVLFGIALIWGAYAHDESLFRFPTALTVDVIKRDAMVVLAGVACLLVLTHLLTWLIKPVRKLSKVLAGLLGGLTLQEIVVLSLVSGIAEEFAFRGVLQAEIGIVATSILFGLVHTGPKPYFVWWGIFATMTGFFLGWLYIETGNLLVPCAIHALINFVNMLSLKRLKQ